jgi:hypothetical protein
MHKNFKRACYELKREFFNILKILVQHRMSPTSLIQPHHFQARSNLVRLSLENITALRVGVILTLREMLTRLTLGWDRPV